MLSLSCTLFHSLPFLSKESAEAEKVSYTLPDGSVIEVINRYCKQLCMGGCGHVCDGVGW